MDKPCSNCGKVIAEVGRLTRVNKKGVKGIWACPECVRFDDDLIERDTMTDEALYVHAEDCPSFCDFACRGEWGSTLADYVNLVEAKEKGTPLSDALIEAGCL